jgi:alkylation response protein AidB-like acyl-CoA dehydrogenase
MQGLLAVSVAGVALGIGHHAVDEIVTLAAAKTPTGSPATLAKWSVAQVEIARAVAALRSGRAFLLETAREIWDTVSGGGQASVEQRAFLRLAASNAVSSAVRATDIAYELGGGSSIYDSSPLQRCLRDVHAVTQHIMVGTASYESAGRALLGLDLEGPFL